MTPWASGILVLVAALLVVGFFVAGRRRTAAIHRITDAADRIARGEVQLEVPATDRPEIADLAGSVNRMKQSLVDKIEELDRDRAVAASVITGMEQGLLLVDPRRRINRANRVIRNLFDLQREPEGRLLAEVIRHPTLNERVETALRDGNEIHEPLLQVGNRSFDLRIKPLGPPTGNTIVLLYDITRIEALESVRREFVANVSHELRTPLTSIKAFLETLLSSPNEDPEARQKFLGIIAKHARRMEDLVDDLTDLSRIETGSVELHPSVFDAAQMCREIATDLEPRTAELDVSLIVSLPAPFTIYADRRRMEQVMTNLMDNAIKFNRQNGQVRVTGSIHQSGGARLVVEDDGVGIAAESADKIFRRFYRVDPARSREAGGTGLGLAIVKHLMRLHGGSITVESELGSGSRFVLELPAAPGSEATRGEQTASPDPDQKGEG
ncbi:hypothetical protein ABI59_10840 [Acidobacteria bacterium Mor1]|nr:hypothetical protein ABI59_10840 [Acidobacteria bacterium Mor1]